jgi:hypothetical protein
MNGTLKSVREREGGELKSVDELVTCLDILPSFIT